MKALGGKVPSLLGGCEKGWITESLARFFYITLVLAVARRHFPTPSLEGQTHIQFSLEGLTPPLTNFFPLFPKTAEGFAQPFSIAT